MTKKEVINFMARIKSHYQEFVIDDYKTSEWYKELEHYDNEDVNKKLDQHLKSQEYGLQIPKLFFLTNYLKTTKQKQVQSKGQIQCKFCEEYVDIEDFDSHYEKCMRINYIDKQADKFNLNIKSNIYNMSIEEIDNVYYKVLDHIKDKVSADERPKLLKVLETK
ncbi:MAG: hypothetical protein WC343_04370 [Bacilli bacterium]|jgi:hypothetical protein